MAATTPDLARVFPALVIGPTYKWDDPPTKPKHEAGKMHKVPMCKWKGMVATDAAGIRREQGRGNRNTFAITGKRSGLFVVDIDVCDNGVTAWRELVTQHGGS